MRIPRLALLASVAVACHETTASRGATKLAFVAQPASAVAGVVIAPPVTVAVQDADGNTVTTATNVISMAIGNSGGATLSGRTTVPAINGVATFSDLRIGLSGTGYTLTASAPALAGATSAPFVVTVGPASKLSLLLQPALVTAGVAMAPALAVAVVDAAGNPVTSATNNITVAIGTGAGGTLSGTTTVAAVNGVATFSGLSIGKAGTYTLSFSSPPLAATSSLPFPVSAAPASKLGFTIQPSTTLAGTVIAPAVRVAVQDPFGNQVMTATNSISVAIGTNAGNGVLSGTTTVVAVNGIATFPDLSINNVGTGYTLTATAAGLGGGTSAAFGIRNPLLFTTIAAGYFHSCGLAVDAAAHCWGENDAGQLGAAVGPVSNLPIPVSGGLSFAKLSAGRTHSCGVTPAGVAYCWGDNSLGAGAATPTSPVPVAVAGGLTFADVIAGYGHTCGVTTGGAGYCWGFNGSGELGNGTLIQSTVPVAVSGGLSFTSISPGRIFTCGLTTAGAAYCWGINGEGELGDGTTIQRASPVPVAGQLVFTMVSAGGFHACGLTSGGAAYCWGQNFFGQLGSNPGTFSSIPRAVAGGLIFATLSAGNRHTCGVTVAGAGYCWGDNSTGMLGTVNAPSFASPAPVSGGLTFAIISAGRFHTCGVTTIGTGYCWGSPGALGDGTNLPRLVPTRVF